MSPSHTSRPTPSGRSNTAGRPGRSGRSGQSSRSYDQFCAIARALDLVGDRWTLLVVRELLAGPRRYTDLHADLPGVSTDVLASRLRDMEQSGIAVRRRAARNGSARVYELTRRGRQLLPVLSALGEWGAQGMEERRPTDAVRAHWLALPLRTALERAVGSALARQSEPGAVVEAAEAVEVRTPEGTFHLILGGSQESDAPAAVLEPADAREAAGAASDPGEPSGAPSGRCEPGLSAPDREAVVDSGAVPAPDAAVEVSQAPEMPAAHLAAGYHHGAPVYGEGPAERADLWLELETETATAIAAGALPLARGVADGSVRFGGPGAAARLLRESFADQGELAGPCAESEG